MIELYKEDKQCCGCAACEAVCPTNNIRMKLNVEGYYYPILLAEEKCIGCGQCLKVCPMKEEKSLVSQSHKVYAAITQDDEVWRSSSSGGAFSEICRALDTETPIIFGARWDGLSVVMDYCEGFNSMKPFRKSKYVIANPNKTYRQVQECLNSGRFVIYSGTPCQINGLKLYLGKEYEKLVTIDFACHGQGSKFVFEKWIQHLEKQYKQKVVSFSFREKKTVVDHVNSNCCSFVLESGEKIIETRDYYHHAYVNGLCVRKSCETCQFAADRKADITLADFKNLKKGWNDFRKKNVSTIITNNFRGENIVRLLKNMTFIEPNPDFVYRYNPKLVRGLSGNPNRDAFMNLVLINHTDILQSIVKYAKMTPAEIYEYNHSERSAKFIIPVINFWGRIKRIPQKICRTSWENRH